MRIISRILPTGLKVFLIPMRGVKSLTGLFVVRAGWRYETEKDIRGISHFLEHMAFKGTQERPTARDISTEVEGRGALINAYTSEEFTAYFIKSSARFKEMIYNVLSDIILNSLLDQAEIDREAGTIVEEIKYYESTPMIYVNILWPKLLYGSQPAGSNGLGTEETIRNLKRNQFVDYMDQFYVVPNSAVIVAGGFTDVEKEAELVGQFFQSLSLKCPERNKPLVEERQTEPGLLLLPKDIEQTWVCFGVRGYSAASKEKYALKLLEVILGGGMSSRMFLEVREKRGLAYAIKSACNFYSDTGSFLTKAGLNSAKIGEAIKVMMDEYHKITLEKVSEEELQKAKDFIKGRGELAMEDSINIACGAAADFAISANILDPQKELKKYETVTPDDIQRVARDIFRNERLNLAMIGPHAKEEDKIRKLLKF